MPYRPQFAYPVLPGDQDFDHYFDPTIVAALNVIVNGPAVFQVSLSLDPDAPFYWRGIKIPMADGLFPLEVRFRDPNTGRLLSDDFIPAWNFAVPPSSGPLNGGQSVALESEIKCPAAGVVQVDLRIIA